MAMLAQHPLTMALDFVVCRVGRQVCSPGHVTAPLLDIVSRQKDLVLEWLKHTRKESVVKMDHAVRTISEAHV
jgi:hypothetical protein